jgi:hypothetical protein
MDIKSYFGGDRVYDVSAGVARKKYGVALIRKTAAAWEVPVWKAWRILQGPEWKEFWKWDGADEFLSLPLLEREGGE